MNYGLSIFLSSISGEDSTILGIGDFTADEMASKGFLSFLISNFGTVGYGGAGKFDLLTIFLTPKLSALINCLCLVFLEPRNSPPPWTDTPNVFLLTTLNLLRLFTFLVPVIDVEDFSRLINFPEV